MSNEQNRRVIEALAECERVLDRARSYLPHNQDVALIATYEAQRAKLVGILA